MSERARTLSTGCISVSRFTDIKAVALLFSVGAFVRLIPELLAFSLPIGFDTIYYATIMKSGVVWAYWSTFFTSTWLLNAFTVPLYGLSQTDPFLLLKIVAPLLYGLNVAGIYWFSRKTLGWNMQMGLLAGFLFVLQLASLRISWDLLRNTLGMGILLFALAYVGKIGSRRGIVLFATLSMLSAFAHEYAAVTLLTVALGLILWNLLRKQTGFNSKRLMLAVFPALTIFGINVFLRFFPVYDGSIPANVIYAHDVVNGNVGSLFFLVDYLQIHSSVDSYSTYTALASSVVILFVLLYSSNLFFVVKGLFKNRVLALWTGLLLLGAFGCLITPYSALDHWYRWMFMLVYPFTFFAVSGLSRLMPHFQQGKATLFSLFSSQKATVTVALTFCLGASLVITPFLMVYANTSLPSVSGTYLYFSTSPAVPYQDVNSLERAMTWLNDTVNSTSCIILQHAYLYWGELYLDKSHVIISFETKLDLAVKTAIASNFTSAYFVWWNTPNAWYNVSVPQSFTTIRSFERISVYIVRS